MPPYTFEALAYGGGVSASSFGTSFNPGLSGGRAALSLPLAGYWLRAPRPILLESLLSLWLAGYALLSLLATASLARLVRAASIEVIERRKTPRSMGEEKAVVTNDS